MGYDIYNCLDENGKPFIGYLDDFDQVFDETGHCYTTDDNIELLDLIGFIDVAVFHFIL